jgi:hypothetical protein
MQHRRNRSRWAVGAAPAAGAAVALALAAAPLGAAPPPAAARPPLTLCALPVDAAWGRAWRDAFAMARRERGRRPPARVHLVVAGLVGRPSLATCHGLAVGSAAPEVADVAGRTLALRLEDAGDLAGAALGRALEAQAAVAPRVDVLRPFPPTPAGLALLAGLAAGLRAHAPAATLLAVGVRGTPAPPAAVVRLAPADPRALVLWRAHGEVGRVFARLDAVVRRSDLRQAGARTFGAADGAFAVAFAPPDAALDRATADAIAAIAAGRRPPSLPDYTTAPIAVAPWARPPDRTAASDAGRRRRLRRSG